MTAKPADRLNDNFIDEVRTQANGHWEAILQQLAIPTHRQEGQCPNCGGKTRYRFDDKEGRGTYFCSHCGAGSGLDLVMKVNQCNARQAAKLVADVLAMPLPEKRVKPAPAKEAPSTDNPIAAQVAALMAKTVLGESHYLMNKGLHCPNLPILPNGVLLLALQTIDGKITGAQRIYPNGDKPYLTGTRKKGAFIPVGELPEQAETVLITEGYATAVTVSLLASDIAIAALDAGNLIEVAKICRERWSEAKIIIAADNDCHQANKCDEKGQLKQNIGTIAAEKAAIAVSGWVALPPTQHKADWDDYRQQYGIEAAIQAFNGALYQPADAINHDKPTRPTLSQMGASQRGEVLLARYNSDLALEPLSDSVHHYDGIAWRAISDRDLMREMVAIFIGSDVPYTSIGIRSAVDALKLQLPLMKSPARHLIGFCNGVFDLQKKQFRPHNKEDGLLIVNEIDFTSPEPGETLVDNTPHFWQWIRRATANHDRKTDRVLAALFMVLANRYDWQLFLEVTGAGGSGKSLLAEICTLLAGKNNRVSASMTALENPRERALIIGYSLIIMPDQIRYVGEGSGIKAITGGDEVSVDPKNKQPYSTRIPAVIVAVNNNAMSFSDRSGGVSRRRVIFNFSEIIPENERDTLLRDKIARELPVIIRHLLTRFVESAEAKCLLLEQQKSAEALNVKRSTDSLVDFCGYLLASAEADGMLVGNAEIIPFNPRKYLYHAYLAYMRGNNLAKPVSVTRFGSDMPGSLAEFGLQYLRKKSRQGIRSNLNLNVNSADEWLPRATGTADLNH
ncbi:primase-helicase zinc-binding domain-containing protein [Candidatus Regiella endosymbiont of Tuberolachnus salignus]|uniref:primase-helicase zinc-binding domain-containing protein n=1 Tax=Candidatus Regiella endosymbiont of Tuberolachnus salignus TaxID=3077956 RepID=UPI0030CE1161